MEKAQASTNQATSNIEKGLDKVDAAFKKVAKAAAAYISVKALVDFGKSCVELGSDLTEVQNVVDVTFGSMSGKIDSFAKSAITQFGLSETAAKQYSSTMGAMLKSMGISTDKVYEMSTSLTGLAGDMASFYNLDPSEAFSKLRAGISGETEPLKQLGINMSVANLEAYALSQGITKSFNAMTQAEQATLRYNYLLDTTKDAQGDFARTSDSWANQVKILSMQFDSLKASLGQGLIVALTPVIKVINQIIAKLAELAGGFKELMATITGTDLTGSTTDAANALADAEESASGVGDAMAGSMDKAAKATKRFLMGFDEIHKLENDTTTDNAAASLADTDALSTMQDLATATDEENAATSKLSQTLEAMKAKLDPVINRGKELAGTFKDGFMSGLGDNAGDRIKGIVEDAKSIGTSVKDIFSDPGVIESANTYADKVAEALGKITGSGASIGLTVGENLVGGVSQYLENSKERISGYISEMFDIRGDTVSSWGDFAQTIARVFSVFGEENGKKVTANLIGTFNNAFMNISLIANKLWRDIVGLFTKPFVMNTEGIRNAVDDVLEMWASTSETINNVITEIGDHMNAVYDDHIKPLFDSVTQGISDLFGDILQVWNSKMKPILDEWGEAVNDLWSNYILPMCTKAQDAFGSLADALKVIWENILQPLLSFIITDVVGNMLPVLMDAINLVIDIVKDVASILSGVWDILKGVLDFITGVFSGDWEKAWEGIKEVFGGFGEVGGAVVQLVLDAISNLLDGVIDFFAGLGSAIASGISSIIDWGKDLLGIESQPGNKGYTLDQAEASGRTWNGAAYSAMQQTGMNRDDMYGAMRDAMDDTGGDEIALYIDGEQIATTTDRSRRYHNTRINPQLAW